MTATVIIGIVALILMTALALLVANTLSGALAKVFLTLDKIDKRNSEALQKTLDRLMTIDWEKFAALRSMEEGDDEGGFEAPGEEEEDVGQFIPSTLGGLRLRLPRDTTAEEEALLAEDFPEEVHG